MKAKGLIAVASTLLLVLVMLSVKSRRDQTPKVYGDDVPNIVRYVEADSDKYHIRSDPNIGFVELVYVDTDSGEHFLAFNTPPREDQRQIHEKTTSLCRLAKAGTGEYLLRLTLKQEGEHLYYLLGIELFQGQSEHRILLEAAQEDMWFFPR